MIVVCAPCSGVQDVIRFTNNIEDHNRYFPRGGPGDRGGEGETDLCGESEYPVKVFVLLHCMCAAREYGSATKHS